MKWLILAVVLLVPSLSFGADKLLQGSDFTYLGSFKIPASCPGGLCVNSPRVANGDYALSFGGYGMSFRPPTAGYPNGSVYLVGRDHYISELGIPALVDVKNSTVCPSHSLSCLNTATWKQGPMDLTQGNFMNTFAGHTAYPDADNTINGTLPFGSNLLMSQVTSYKVAQGSDTPNGPIYTHAKSALDWTLSNLSSPGFQGWYQVNAFTSDPIRNAGMVGGYMASIPNSYQSVLGGSVLTGMLRSSVISAGSFGPVIATFDPTAMTGANTTVVSSNLLAAYPYDGQFCNSTATDGLSAPSPYGSMVTYPRGALFPVGSKSVALVGMVGLGETGTGDGCYGEGTSDPTQMKTVSEVNAWVTAHGTNYTCGGASMPVGGNACCYDPANSTSKGNHAYPYVYRVWLYSADDLAAVKAGTKTYDSVFPYAQTDLNSYTIVPYRAWDSGTGKWSTTVNPSYQYTLNSASGGAAMPLADENAIATAGFGGVGYDATNQIMYISALNSDTSQGLEPLPVIHAYRINLAATASAPALSGTISGTIH